jgi:hypothetical protein
LQFIIIHIKKKEEGRRPFDYAQGKKREEGRRKKEEGEQLIINN